MTLGVRDGSASLVVAALRSGVGAGAGGRNRDQKPCYAGIPRLSPGCPDER